MKQRPVAVLGSGSWGTALSVVLADNGHDVRLWGRSQDVVDDINLNRKNEKYLNEEIEIPEKVHASTDLSEVVTGVDTVIFVVPTKAVRPVCQEISQYIQSPVTFVHASKGVEPGSSLRISEMMAEELPQNIVEAIVALSGPSHAEEVSLRQPTTVTSSSNDQEAAKRVQDLFMNASFRVYTNSDMIGVELGGALKNIIALASGLTNGLGYGDNAKAALMTRGLAEISRLGTKMGANPLTFAGLSGLGDLIVTCTSVHSRNWRAGQLIGQGMSVDDVLEEMGMVVEGIRTTKAAKQLADQEKVEMPITSELYDVLFHDKTPEDAVQQLMVRVKKQEVEEPTFDTSYGQL
ncbi:NAD(P)H-dependent glycerol-3-phosphate dehydrogenase [Texcoconibacillus texcoconensis]|uniref:Glycerol-3-phosphate dehydrogenase [NAD(P)+] n=1 Tax=Texcoconibacillus texcoconensis TaxID=1095777 RepID=A0A840QNE9_9BACI|nr:glycerol-3-phosphate dehydrogenase (NAD(P)+) [Texcoconibacillus texcoconensis]